MKYQIHLSDAQKKAIEIIKKSRKVVLFEDTLVVCIDLKNYEYMSYQMLRSFEMMELLVWKRKIGREQHEFRLNTNQLNRVII